MKRQRWDRANGILLTGALLVTATARQGFGWGAEGHKAVAAFAEHQLNPAGRAAVARLLGRGKTLASVATWADDVRSAGRRKGPLVKNKEAQQFNMNNPHNGDWHFVNLPLGAKDYQDNGSFSSENDVVHAINHCIALLETPEQNPKFTKSQALRMLVHLVGDIHQPLHAATGYYTVDGGPPTLITDPAQALHQPDDRGGNDLCYQAPAQGTDCFPQEVHALWDTDLVEAAGRTKSVPTLVGVLEAKAKDQQWVVAHKDVLDDPPGDYHQWAEHWAAASVKQANAAYQGIRFGKAIVSQGKIERISVTLPQTYSADQTDRATAQLVAGGIHLAHLMNQIKWQ